MFDFFVVGYIWVEKAHIATMAEGLFWGVAGGK